METEDDGVNGALVFNGVDAATGLFLSSPASEREFAQHIHDEPLSGKPLKDIVWWIKRHPIEDNERVGQDDDPLRLDSAGWGVIFAPGVSAEIEAALDPLLKRRKEAAGTRFRKYRPTPEQVASKEKFLAACKAGLGANNSKKVPYYLLIVGSPEEISFRFQYELDVPYAVGRLHFDDESAYGVYARSVKETEEAAEAGSKDLPPKQISLWGVSHQGDMPTQRSEAELIKPLSRALKEDRPDWPRKTFTGAQAKKEQLSRLLGGGETPSILLTASHGMSYPLEDRLQRTCQGALLCQDWPGEGNDVSPEHFFSGLDLTGRENLRGLIALNFACYSGGTPQISSFADSPTSRPQPLAPAPFISNLAQRLLGHPQGALAVIGHIDRVWSTTFSWSELGQIDLFENTLKRLLDGHPIGHAMEYFNHRHAELSVLYAELCQDVRNLIKVDYTEFSRVYRANNDARNFIVLGDPAVRPVYRGSAKASEAQSDRTPRG